MTETAYIEHIGLVSSVEDDTAHITLIEPQECAGCKVKNVCGINDEERRLFDVPCSNSDLHPGDEVILRIKPTTGFSALAWGYLVPFALVVVVLFLSLAMGWPEEIAGLFALSALVPYYFTLWALKAYFKEKLNLEVKKR